jgi:hypothetical protein
LPSVKRTPIASTGRAASGLKPISSTRHSVPVACAWPRICSRVGAAIGLPKASRIAVPEASRQLPSDCLMP